MMSMVKPDSILKNSNLRCLKHKRILVLDTHIRYNNQGEPVAEDIVAFCSDCTNIITQSMLNNINDIKDLGLEWVKP